MYIDEVALCIVFNFVTASYCVGKNTGENVPA